MSKLDTYSAVAPVAASKATTPTPDNTPIPGGGSWHWDYTQHAWAANTPDQPLQPGTAGAVQTLQPTQE